MNENKLDRNIRKYLLKGNLSNEIPHELIDGLVYYLKLFIMKGFELNAIKEVSSIGQVISNEFNSNKIKGEVESGKLKSNSLSSKYEMNESYIDLLQIELVSGNVYVVAFNSPGDYWGTFSGILWIQELEKKLILDNFPNARIDFLI